MRDDAFQRLGLVLGLTAAGLLLASPAAPAQAWTGTAARPVARAKGLAADARAALLAEDFARAASEARMALEEEDPGSALAEAVLGNAQAVLALQGQIAGPLLQRDLRESALVEARRHLERALAADPGLAIAHNGLGVVLAGEGRLDDAQGEFERALALEPSLAMAHGNLGFVLALRDRLPEAEQHYRQAIALAPDGSVARNGLANVLTSQGQYADAERSCREAIERYPRQDTVLATFYVNLAVALHGQGRAQAAREAVARAKALGLPRHPAYAAIAGAAAEPQ